MSSLIAILGVPLDLFAISKAAVVSILTFNFLRQLIVEKTSSDSSTFFTEETPSHIDPIKKDLIEIEKEILNKINIKTVEYVDEILSETVENKIESLKVYENGIIISENTGYEKDKNNQNQLLYH